MSLELMNGRSWDGNAGRTSSFTQTKHVFRAPAKQEYCLGDKNLKYQVLNLSLWNHSEFCKDSLYLFHNLSWVYFEL